MRPLFERFPDLAARVPHVELAELPTPVEQMTRLGQALGLESLWIKRDDRTARTYGGNKVRKLEFLLAEARRRGARETVTVGFAGSNHALATAIYARRAGLRPISVLVEQEISDTVRRNLLGGLASGAELHHVSSFAAASRAVAWLRARRFLSSGRLPYFIPGGGSSPLGALGFVNAGLELAAQVRSGALPEPHVIYVAAGTLGTVAGLAVGLAAAGLVTRVEAVRVVDAAFATERRLEALTAGIGSLLGWSGDAASRVRLRHEFFGLGYGIATAGGEEAMDLAANEETVALEGTYTGKTMSALIADARAGALARHSVLFWNTFSSADLVGLVGGSDWRRLPAAFHRYFVC